MCHRSDSPYFTLPARCPPQAPTSTFNYQLRHKYVTSPSLQGGDVFEIAADSYGMGTARWQCAAPASSKVHKSRFVRNVSASLRQKG
eukprot:4502191-Pleurochrysis_carterae.AAC.1